MSDINGQQGMIPVDIVKAMIPYADSNTAATLNVMLKAGDLMSSLQKNRSHAELSINELGNQNADMEGMIMAVQAICGPKEREMLDSILMIIRAQKIMSVSNDKNMMFDVITSILPSDQKGMFDEILPILAMMS